MNRYRKALCDTGLLNYLRIYNRVEGQTYSDVGIDVFEIASKPPLTSVKSCQPLCLSIDAAIILL